MGCDFKLPFNIGIVRKFQSTHPRGVRLMEDPRYARVFDVSIHAPAWGATIEDLRHAAEPRPFQSTHPRGVRHQLSKRDAQLFLFQSTHPRGVRRGKDARSRHSINVSIHAPAWGATHHLGQESWKGQVSIHAPAWGATVANDSPFWLIKCFNPRTRVGCDRNANGRT